MKTILQILIVSSIIATSTKYFKIYEVATSSMEPSLKTRSVVLSVNTNEKSKFKQGDIVTYKIPQFLKPVTHRIMRAIVFHNKEFFITKGDNNISEDPYPITKDEIIGKVILVIPYLGTLLKVISSYKFLFISFYGPLGFLLGKILKNYFKQSNR
ncbi:MAG: signal peptidase I [Patescibacteria group bacterium]|jgi:signal peptidase